mgnify:FL=1
MTKVLKIEHLNKSFGKRVILKNINLQINSGSIVALVGANGAGKTTLINIILNLIPKNSGEINFTTNNWRQITGVMMQDNLSMNRITVKEIINLSRSYFIHPLPYNQLLHLTGLENHEKRMTNKLSGGQKRRLAFALAVSGDPQILFLDEPTVGMDSNARHDFWQEVDRLKQSGKTIFVTSHYLEELENIADRFLILQNSKIAFDGSIQQLRDLSGECLIEFDSKLQIIDFQNLKSIVSVNLVGHHYQLITNDTNNLMEEIVPFFKAIENLQVKQTNLDTLLLSYQEEPQND